MLASTDCGMAKLRLHMVITHGFVSQVPLTMAHLRAGCDRSHSGDERNGAEWGERWRSVCTHDGAVQACTSPVNASVGCHVCKHPSRVSSTFCECAYMEGLTRVDCSWRRRGAKTSAQVWKL